MHGLAHDVVAPEREAEVAHAAADLDARVALLEQARGLDVALGVVVVLLEAGGHGEDVGVEDDVARIESGLLRQQLVRAPEDLHATRGVVRLADLVEGHDDDTGAVAPDQLGLLEEVCFSFLEADRVDDGLALDALESCLDDAPLGAVDHDRDPRHLRLGGHEVEERRHRGFGVEHPLVHVDVEDVGAAPDLLEGDVECGGVVLRLDQAHETPGTRDVGALPHHREVGFGADREGLETGEAAVARPRIGDLARGQSLDGRVDRPDVVRRRAAAAADDVHEAGLGKLLHEFPRAFGALVVLPKGIGQSRVGIAADGDRRKRRKVSQERPHLIRAKRAVDADRNGLCVLDAGPEGVDRLAGERAAALVGDRDGDHHGHACAALFEHFFQRHDRGLGVERVEDRLDQEDVDAAIEQPAGLFLVGIAYFVERHGAKRRVLDVGRDRKGAVGGPQRASHEARLARVPL